MNLLMKHLFALLHASIEQLQFPKFTLLFICLLCSIHLFSTELHCNDLRQFYAPSEPSNDTGSPWNSYLSVHRMDNETTAFVKVDNINMSKLSRMILLIVI